MNAISWSIRRELWEHRWLWGVPLGIGAVVVFVFAGVLINHAGDIGVAAAAEAQRLTQGLAAIYDLTSRMLLMTGTMVGFVYCAEALHGERRDRAILFWKSWPVGDGTAVVAKAMIPLLVVPAITLVLLLVTQMTARLVLLRTGIALHAPIMNPAFATLEVLAATLWTAPVYAWIMVVSAWARRAVLLLAGFPVIVVSIVEAIVTRDHVIGRALANRGVGRYLPSKLSDNSFGGPMIDTPAPELLVSPALWFGVIAAVLLLVAVAQLRSRMVERY